MTRQFSINVPENVENEQAYIKAVKARIEGNARKGRATRWLASHPDAQRAHDFLFACGEFAPAEVLNADDYVISHTTHPLVEASFGDFRQKMFDSLVEWGSLTDGQTAAVVKMIDRAAERIAKREELKQVQRDGSQHVGVEGERRDFDLQVTFVTGFETQFGWTNVIGMTDADGNVYVYKGSSTLKNDQGDCQLTKGDRVVVTATLSHGERDGVKQNILKRPKQK
jgi:hypothetical protein